MGIELTEPKIGNSDIDLEIGDAVEVSNGPFAGQVGTVEAIDVETKEVKCAVDQHLEQKTLFVCRDR